MSRGPHGDRAADPARGQPGPAAARGPVLDRGGHACRPGLSAAGQQARGLAAGWMAGAGLKVSVGAAGNLAGRAPGTSPGLPEAWTRSHPGTVPGGGRLDGTLGVVAGLEAVTAARARPHARTLAVAAFRDEEGWRFGQGYFARPGAVRPARAGRGGVSRSPRETASAADISAAVGAPGRALAGLAGGPGR